MDIERLTIKGERYVLVPEADFERIMVASAGVTVADRELPPFPEKLPSGNYPALEYSRVSMARKIITERRTAGLSQQELAHSAGIRPETLNRIEKAKVSADAGTIAKIDKVLSRAVRQKDRVAELEREQTGPRSSRARRSINI